MKRIHEQQQKEEEIALKEEQDAETFDFIENLHFTKKIEDLNELARESCPKCKKNKKYFCYDCFVPTPSEKAQPPIISLPLKVIIIQHPGEVKGKSTAIHAKLISPDCVDIYQYPNIPAFLQEEAKYCVLLYPTEDAISISDLATHFILPDTYQTSNQSSDSSSASSASASAVDVKSKPKLKYLVVVDSTWQQSKKIMRDPLLGPLKRIKITSQKTHFWRYQKCGESYLATIEAIYYFFKELHTEMMNQKYSGEFDNLLFYYAFFYSLIQNKYLAEGKSFSKIEGWLEEPAKKKMKSE